MVAVGKRDSVVGTEKGSHMRIGCFALVEPFCTMSRQLQAIREMGLRCADLTDNHNGGMLGVGYGFAASERLFAIVEKLQAPVQWAAELGVKLLIEPHGIVTDSLDGMEAR